MKQCINNQCKHELDDYQDRCPYCGWSQKSFKSVTPKNVGDLQDKVKLNDCLLYTSDAADEYKQV